MSRRVTLFINSLRGGGAERVCVSLANELRSLEWDVQIVVLNLRDAVVRAAVRADVPVVDLQVEHVRQSAVAVARYIRANRPRLFLVFNHQLAVLLVWLRWLNIGRYAIVARNISTLSLKAVHEPSLWHSHVVNGFTYLFYRGVDRVVAQSHGMKRDLIANYRIREQSIRVIDNPLAPAYQGGDPLIPWGQRRHEVLYVGRLTAIKGLDLLIAACAACMREDPQLRLRLLGRGEDQLALQRQAEQAGIADRVVFEGYVADPGPFYAHAKVLAMTSHYEGFPNVLLEANSQGTPVVSVDCASGPAEIVEQGVNGVLVRSREVREFAQALQDTLSAEWDVERVRRSAARFSIHEVGRQYAAELLAADSARTQRRRT